MRETKRNHPLSLSRRERQIMDVLHRRAFATAAEITAELDDAPSNTTVRTLLRILTKKRHVTFRREGTRYVYKPAESREDVGASMMSYVVRTFFEGSPLKAMTALLGQEPDALTEAQISRLEALLAHRPEDSK